MEQTYIEHVEMKTIQWGVTLIEQVFVAAIVGILAAIALPAYQDYIARSKTTERSEERRVGKECIAEYVASNGAITANDSSAGLAAPVAAEYMSTAYLGYSTRGRSRGCDVQF